MQELRRSFDLGASSAPSELKITRAYDLPDFEGAFECLYESYKERGLAVEHPWKLRLTRHHLTSTTRVFVASSGRQVVGTLSLVGDQPLAVPMRCIFDSEINELIGDSTKVAEATCLAVRGSATTGIRIVHSLMGVALQSACNQAIEKVVIAVHPRHVPFYIRSMGFRPFTPVKPYPVVGGAPAVAMVLNIQTLHVDAPEAYQRYVGMRFSPMALSSRPLTPRAVQRLTALWQDTHTDAEFLSINGRSQRLKGRWHWGWQRSDIAAAG